MSSNVHPNPGPIFPRLVCAGNVTWRGKSVQCCTCSNWVHLRCSEIFLSKFRTLGSSHSWSCPPAVSLLSNTVIPSSDSSDMYTSIVQTSPPPPSANAALPPHSHLQTSYPPFAHFVSSPTAPLLLAVLLCLLSPLTLSGFFNGMLEVFEPGALLRFLLSHPVDLICIQESNLNSSSSFWILCSAF